MNTEPIPGTIYEFRYITGSPYDPSAETSKGVFLKKITSEGFDYYLVAQKLPHSKMSFRIYYLDKFDIKKSLGANTDDDFAQVLNIIESPDFKHPKYLRQYVTPTQFIMKENIDTFSKKQTAQEKIKNFMTQAIYVPPIRRANNSVIFSGGPMYKRALASYAKQGGKSRRRTNKRRNRTRKH